MRNRWYVILMLGLTLLLIGLSLGCRPKPAPEPEVVAETQAEATDTSEPPKVTDDELDTIRRMCEERSERGQEKQLENPDDLPYPPFQDLIYVKGQVIITGPPGEIDKVVERLNLSQLKMREFALGRREVAVRLYRIHDGTSVEQVTCEINGLGRMLGNNVFADPNYHTSPAGGWSGGGSPWTQNGGWSQGIDGGGLGWASGEAFREQWALGENNIGLLDGGGNRMLKGLLGTDISVYIFDTSPFSLPLPVQEGEWITDSFYFSDLARDVFPELEGPEPGLLTVWHTVMRPAPDCPGIDHSSGITLENQDISNHGLFVAGLVHAVAPSSDIHLVRVLEDDGCGDLFGIDEAIETFMDKALEDGVKGIVINLSLGVHEPPDPASFSLPEEVTSLQFILQEAIGNGAVVVAAAGNDSYDKLAGPPSEMEIPASDCGVIGVAASSFEHGRGCFSNMGDVAAPGGNGVDKETPCVVPDCLRNDNCGGLCLISLVYRPEPAYAYWVGTSFAAPLVSGQAALLLEATQGDSVRTVNAIRAGVTPTDPDFYLGGGIISIQKSLEIISLQESGP